MKVILFLVLCLLIQIETLGQKKKYIRPYILEIRPIITDVKSPYFYPNLESRYLNNDTTLNSYEYFLFYYGYYIYFDNANSCTNQYFNSLNSVYLKDTMITNTEGLNKTIKISKKILSKEDYLDIIKFENSILKTCYFSMKDLQRLANAYHKIDDLKSEYFIQYKINMITKTILNSGNGKSRRTAYHIDWDFHESYIIEYLGLLYDGSTYSSINGTEIFSYVMVKNNPEKIRGIYFDKSLMVGRSRQPIN